MPGTFKTEVVTCWKMMPPPAFLSGAAQDGTEEGVSGDGNDDGQGKKGGQDEDDPLGNPRVALGCVLGVRGAQWLDSTCIRVYSKLGHWLSQETMGCDWPL